MNQRVEKVRKDTEDAIKEQLRIVLIQQKVLGHAAGEELNDLIDALRTALQVVHHGSYHAAFRKEKQLEGIAKAKAHGTHFGNPSTINYDAIRKELANGMHPKDIVKKLNVSRAAVYRVKGPSTNPNTKPSAPK